MKRLTEKEKVPRALWVVLNRWGQVIYAHDSKACARGIALGAKTRMRRYVLAVPALASRRKKR